MSPQTLKLISVILCVFTTGSLSGRLKMVVSPDVTALRGEDVILGCSFTDTRRQQGPSGLVTVQWSAREARADPFLTCAGKNDSAPGLSSCFIPGLRFSLSGDPWQGDASLLIRDARLSDEGGYFCSVDVDGSSSQQKIQLHVKAEPQILSLSLLETPSAPDGANRRLQCEAEGSPRPKIVWLSPSKRMIENQGIKSESGQYRLIGSVPYPEEGEELICRAENELGNAERMFPNSRTMMLTLVVCGAVMLLLLLLLSTGGIVYCRRHRAGRNSAGETDDRDNTDTLVVYSTLGTSASFSPINVLDSRPHREAGVLYSPVTVQQKPSSPHDTASMLIHQ